MTETLSLKESLITEDSIRLNTCAIDWQNAIEVACSPLVESGAITPDYAEDIIVATKKYGPYYILTDRMAMPHAQPNEHVMRDAFSFMTLTEPVEFPDGKPVQILVILAATNPDVHVSIAIPQIVAVFEQKGIVDKILNITDKDEIIKIIEQSDYKKYIN